MEENTRETRYTVGKSGKDISGKKIRFFGDEHIGKCYLTVIVIRSIPVEKFNITNCLKMPFLVQTITYTVS